MNPKLQALETLLIEISELGAVAEDKGISRIPSLDPLLEKARSFGITIAGPTTRPAYCS
jgi:hypothetical protein